MDDGVNYQMGLDSVTSFSNSNKLPSSPYGRVIFPYSSEQA